MREPDVAWTLSRAVSEALVLAGAAVAVGAGFLVLVSERGERTKERERGSVGDEEETRIIAGAVEGALRSGAKTPESYAREISGRGCYVCYRRERDGSVVGSSYGIRGRNERYAGSVVGYPWGRVAERLGLGRSK